MLVNKQILAPILFPILGLCLALPVYAEPIQIGSTIEGFELADQFGEEHKIESMPRTLVLTFEKAAGALVNDFLTRQAKGYLAQQNALYVADISRMPSLITRMFALPKMRKYPYTMLLEYNEDFHKNYPMEPKKVTVIKFDEQNRVTAIAFVDDEKALEQEILR